MQKILGYAGISVKRFIPVYPFNFATTPYIQNIFISQYFLFPGCDERHGNIMKKNDVILIGVVVFMAVAAIAIWLFTRTEGTKLNVTVDGKVIKTFDLDEDITYTIEVDEGQWNTFRIKDGYVEMLEASCPDKVCVNHGSIHYDKETITCLPNKVVLEIVGGEDNPIDSIAN